MSDMGNGVWESSEVGVHLSHPPLPTNKRSNEEAASRAEWVEDSLLLEELFCLVAG